MSCLVYTTAAALDRTVAARSAGEGEAVHRWRERVDLLIPLTKGLCTDVCNELTSLAVQVHGGKSWPEGAKCRWKNIKVKSLE